MTKRRPPGVSTESWVEAQIRRAAERGEFDNLPGAGKPLPALSDEAWLAAYLRREGVPADALLPEPLLLRKEVERLPELLAGIRAEATARKVVHDLNARIDAWMRSGTGTIIVPPVDEDLAIERWRATRPVDPAPAEPVSSRAPGKRRWWRAKHTP